MKETKGIHDFDPEGVECESMKFNQSSQITSDKDKHQWIRQIEDGIHKTNAKKAQMTGIAVKPYGEGITRKIQYAKDQEYYNIKTS